MKHFNTPQLQQEAKLHLSVHPRRPVWDILGPALIRLLTVASFSKSTTKGRDIASINLLFAAR